MPSRLESCAVYPCTYRELVSPLLAIMDDGGISLYLQGTLHFVPLPITFLRYIPVPTGNSGVYKTRDELEAVYPCTYRELTN